MRPKVGSGQDGGQGGRQDGVALSDTQGMADRVSGARAQTERGRIGPGETQIGKIPQAGRPLDQLDRTIAAALQINPRATWRQVAAAVGSTEFTVRRRAERLFSAGLIRSTVITDAIARSTHVLLQFTCHPARAVSVARALADRDDVRFVAAVTGPFDVVAELVTPSNRDLARIILEELPAIDGITGTTTETVLRNFKTSYDWSRDLLGTQAGRLYQAPPQHDEPPEPVTLDDVDLRIVEQLTKDGRRTFADLASDCGVTESMARRHVDHLFTRAGVRPITLVDPHLLGYDVELLLWLHVDLAQLEHVAAALATRREVRYISATSGYSDLVCEIILRSQSDLYEFFITVLAPLAGLRRVDVASELVTLKRSHLQLG